MNESVRKIRAFWQWFFQLETSVQIDFLKYKCIKFFSVLKKISQNRISKHLYINEFYSFITPYDFFKYSLDKEIKSLGIKVVKIKNYEISYSEVLWQKCYTSFDDFLPNGVVIDVGAQYGDYSVLCAKLYNSIVYSFEPLPTNFKILKKNITINKLNKKIKAFNVAVGAVNKNVVIKYSGDMGGVVGDSNLVVKMISLDNLSLKPNLLKIDAEGFELDVLKGGVEMIKKNKPKIIVETHSKKLRRDVNSFLKNNRYKLEHIGKISTTDPAHDELVTLFYKFD